MRGVSERGAVGPESSGTADGMPAGDHRVVGKRAEDQQRVHHGPVARFGAGLRRRRDLPKLAPVWWPVGWRCVGVAILISALGALAYESGKQTTGVANTSTSVWQSVITTITKPGVAIFLASLIVLGLASLLRRLRIEWLVLKPGPIFVRELSVAPGVSDVDVDHLTTDFRVRLMQLRLHAPTPVPGTTPAEDFLAVLDGEHLDTKNLLGSAVSILRAAIPNHAYEVSVTLTEEAVRAPEKPHRGVTAQVTRLPNEGLPVETAWSYSWDDAIRQAADIVSAAVLPRTVLSNRSPWSGWRRYPMPSLLVHHYEKAQELTSLRRYDEALDHYFLALELDPKNVDLRLCKGFVEEKLGLYLDAVATYAAARRVADQTSRRLYHRRARRDRTASGNIARYRLAVLLGGIKFAHQWRKQDTKTQRDKHRVFLRGRLNPELQELLDDHKLMLAERDGPNHSPQTLPRRRSRRRRTGPRSSPEYVPEEVTKLLDEFGTDEVSDEHDRRYYELRRMFAKLAQMELRAVRRYVRWHRTPPGSLTPLSVDVTMGGLDLRLQYIERMLAKLDPGRASQTSEPSIAWMPDPEATLSPSARRFQSWTEEYNAACLYALPLLVCDLLSAPGTVQDKRPDKVQDERRRQALAEEAVKHLTNAMSSTVGWYAAQRRDWVLSEDPDLDGLRPCPLFKHFEAVYFPSPAPTSLRPRGSNRWEQSRYTNRLLAETGRRWETVWHQRRDLLTSRIDPHMVIQWSKDEADAWQAVECVAKDYRHWPVRCDLIEQMKVWGAKYGFDPIGVDVPRFVREYGQDRDDNAADDDDLSNAVKLEKAVKLEVERNEERLREVVDQLVAMAGRQNHDDSGQTLTHQQFSSQPDGFRSQLRDHQLWARVASALGFATPQYSHLERLQDELRDRDFWHRAAPKLYLPSVCDVHAAMWQRLHEWLEELPDDRPTAGSEFACAVSQAARLSGTLHGLWVLVLIDRRVRRLTSGGHRNGAKAGNGTSPAPT